MSSSLCRTRPLPFGVPLGFHDPGVARFHVRGLERWRVVYSPAAIRKTNSVETPVTTLERREGREGRRGAGLVGDVDEAGRSAATLS